MPQAAEQTASRDKFRAAYRMARVAYRGLKRQALKIDLQQPRDYSPNCRHCNAGAEIVRKVAAVIGYSDNLALCTYSQAVRIAFGERVERQRGMPGALDFAGWIEWRQWAAQVQQAA